MNRNKKIVLTTLAIFLFCFLSSFLYFHIDLFRNLLNAYSCPFKTLTSYPCASCGFTRCVLFFGSGKFKDAFLVNPLCFIILSYLFVLLLINLTFVIQGSHFSLLWPLKTKPKTAAVILIIALILSWVYKLSMCIFTAAG